MERQNLNMRMNMRHFTRLTNAFSKKIENQIHSIALFHMRYNLFRTHQTLRVTPVVATGLTTRLWSVYDIEAMTVATCNQVAA